MSQSSTEPRVDTKANLPIRVGQKWHSCTKIGEGIEGGVWTVSAVGPVWILLTDENCESHLIQESIRVDMWHHYFDKLIKGF